MKKLGGFTFVWRGNDQDYCYKETILSLVEVCDQISVVAGGTDKTSEEIERWIYGLRLLYPAKKFYEQYITEEEWNAQVGREKLSYFSNKAADMLTTDWNFYLQCDEIIHEDSYQYIRQAIEHENVEAYLVSRYNLWQDPYHILNVEQARKPCSTEVIRLAKKQYRCVDDAESIMAPAHIFGRIDSIEIWHAGFVRDKVKHLVKIENMLVNVFLHGETDQRATNCDQFIPERFFNPSKDIIPIHKPLPKIIQKWAEDRYPDIKKPEF